MTTQRDLVEQLFETALECAPSERGAFLDQACSHDPELRHTIEELLADDAEAGNFLEHPPLAFLGEAEMCAATGPIDLNEFDLAKTGGRLVPNQILIDRFIIVRFIAKGGMGEVYEAADCLLQGAKVAVKTILPQIARDPDLQQRFEAEVLLARRVNPLSSATAKLPVLNHETADGRNPGKAAAENYVAIDQGRIDDSQAAGRRVDRHPRRRHRSRGYQAEQHRARWRRFGYASLDYRLWPGSRVYGGNPTFR
jgi:hypothetical protein